LFIVFASVALGQNTFRAIIRDAGNKEPLVGATALVKGTSIGASADSLGNVIIGNIPNGRQMVIFRFVGYEERADTLDFPLVQTEPMEVLLYPEAEEMEEVIVSSTRSSRTIVDLPTRVEAISGEELEEKGNMKPGDIRMLLNESTGIQTQQTSATSYNSGIRIQGLDGKYTQLLREGMPLYAGFSGGLSLMQVAPLDLKQVEVIKGASSTLYGGGAIAGLVNMIPKAPGEERELSFMVNGTSALGLDASGFYAQKSGKAGATVFASCNLGTPYDPADIGFSAIPEFKRFTINPKLYFYLSNKTTFNVGVNATKEERIGGDMLYLDGKGDNVHSYFEENVTGRVSTQMQFDHLINEVSKFTIRNSVSFYDRSIQIPDYSFAGVQTASFSEANYSYKGEKSEWIGGLNLWTDKFIQDKPITNVVDYNHTTFGGFVQNTWDATEKFVIETGLRGDYQNKYGFFALPRISAMLKAGSRLTMRLGGGLGYKTPTVFTEDAERIQFRNVLPINESITEAEKSIGANFDINFKTPVADELFFSINALLFYTRVNHPLILMARLDGFFEYQQPEGYIDTKGIETNMKLSYGDFKLFVGYTFADVKQHYDGTETVFPLVAKHRLNNVLMYEVEEKWKIGLEGYYFSPQQLNDGATGKEYWIFGFMAERLWEKFSVFVNFENFTDTRQTKFDTIYNGTITNPVFRDIYAPVDGFVINGGFKIRL